MNMPGYTAEASLYETDEPYHMGRTGSWMPPGFPQSVSP
jgi:hypothetical protein